MTADLDSDEKKALEENIAWLASTSPDDWHRVALDFNWSEPLYVLDWIVRQDDCDLATALTVFWLGEPEAWMNEKRQNDEAPNGFSFLNAQICAYIANRVSGTGYARSEIAFAPDTWTKTKYLGLVAHEQSLDHPNFRAHPDLIRDRSGRAVDLSSDFYARYPERFHLSSYSEELDDGIERGVYETPQSIALMQRMNQVELETMQRLPGWLKPEPDLEEIRSEASSTVYNTIFVGILLSALATGGLSRFGETLGAVVGCGLVAWVSYSVISNVREIEGKLHACGWQISRRWLAGSLGSSLLLGAGIAYPVVGHIGAWRESYGTLAVALVALGIVLPGLWFTARFLVDLLVSSRSVRRDPA